jgi:hypothetical protein
MNMNESRYDPTQDEIDLLRKALSQTGHSAAGASDSELGLEYSNHVRWLLRQIVDWKFVPWSARPHGSLGNHRPGSRAQ